MILRPPAPISASIGRVAVAGPAITARYPEKHDTWRTICRDCSLRWSDGRWLRILPHSTPESTVNHRAAELVHRLLLANFIVEAPDAIAAMATHATYTPESRRNVRTYTAGEYANWFTFTWMKTEDGNKLYNLVTRLPGAHWDGRCVVVSREHYEEVIDFAQTHGFRLSEGARQLAGLAEAEIAGALLVEPLPIAESAPIDMKTPVLPVPDFVTIDQELIDDEYDDTTA